MSAVTQEIRTTCTCPHGDAHEPIANHDQACPAIVGKCRACGGETTEKSVTDEAIQILTGVADIMPGSGSLLKCRACRTLKACVTLRGRIDKIMVTGKVTL